MTAWLGAIDNFLLGVGWVVFAIAVMRFVVAVMRGRLTISVGRPSATSQQESELPPKVGG
jgi:hypothetical protein